MRVLSQVTAIIIVLMILSLVAIYFENKANKKTIEKAYVG